MRILVLGSALVAGLALPSLAEETPRHAYTPPAPKPGHSYPECYCTDSTGQRVEVGELACLQIGSRQVLSRCEKARNLVIWRHQATGCAPNV